MSKRLELLNKARRAVTNRSTSDPRLASDLGSRFGIRNATPSAISAYMKRHPIATLLGLSTALAGSYAMDGMLSDSEIDELIGLFANNPKTQSIIEELARNRQRIYDAKGDGSPDTVSGISTDKFQAAVVLTKEAMDRIDEGVGVFGSLRALEYAVKQLPLIELEHLDTYRILND